MPQEDLWTSRAKPSECPAWPGAHGCSRGVCGLWPTLSDQSSGLSMGFTVTRGLVDWQGLILRVYQMAWSPRMLMRGPWPVDHPDRSVLQEGSKGPLPVGGCDSQPLAWESMDQAVSMPHRVRNCSETSSMHGPPCQHPPCKASSPAGTRGAPPPPATAESTQHTRFTCLRGPWPMATAVAGPRYLTSPKRTL